MHRALILGLCLAGSLAPQKPQRQKRAPPPVVKVMRVVCTPTTIAVEGQAATPSANPIAEALGRALPGARIELESGTYPGIGIGYRRDAAWSAKTSGGLPGRPITVIGKGKARIYGKSDAITVSQEIRNGHITFENIELVPGYRSAVLFAKGSGPEWVHAGYRFLDCDIVGAWNHETDSGEVSSKWGVHGQALADFEFRGVTRPVRVVDLRREHAFYLQNLRGDVRIENVRAARLGRTFVQLTARTQEGPPSVGTVTIQDCQVEDVCIAAGDNYKGGSAFTIAGRHTGTVRLIRNRYRAGFQPALRKLTRPESPYGTGALVAWDGGEEAPTAELILDSNDFEFAPGCGDRALVAIGACNVVRFVGTNRFVAGANPAALEFEPVREARPEGSPVGAVEWSPTTEVRGSIRRRGRAIAAEDIARAFPTPAPSVGSLPPQDGAGDKR